MRPVPAVLSSLIFFSASCHRAQPVAPIALPDFREAYVCGRSDTGPSGAVPDILDISRDCLPIDAGRFREFVIEATPAPDAGWKGEFLVLARTSLGGDQYFHVSVYGGFFGRPGVRGIYVIPTSSRSAWEQLVFATVLQRERQSLLQHERQQQASGSK
jgi:hypothetical protein